MISRPARLEDWTIDLVREIAASGIGENDWYEFKGDLQSADHQRKTVAAFANTQGGFLVFGVTNARQVVGLDKPELPRDFGIKLTSGLNPSVAFRFLGPLILPASTGAAVWVCEVPRSPRAPHGVLVNEHWVFPRRMESGSNVTMSVEEIRSVFQNSEQQRAAFLLFTNEVRRINEIAERQATQSGPLDSAMVVRYNTARLEGSIPLIFTVITENPLLVSKLNELRDAASEADTFLSGTSVYTELNSFQKNAVRGRVGQDGQRVLVLSRTVLRLLEGVTP